MEGNRCYIRQGGSYSVRSRPSRPSRPERANQVPSKLPFDGNRHGEDAPKNQLAKQLGNAHFTEVTSVQD